MKASFTRILGLNLAIILSVGVALRLAAEDSEVEGLGFIIRFAFAIVVQFFLNALFGLIARLEATKQSFWTAALVTLLIGFGACIGGTFTY